MTGGRILLNKIDLVSPAELDAAEKRIRAINGAAGDSLSLSLPLSLRLSVSLCLSLSLTLSLRSPSL